MNDIKKLARDNPNDQDLGKQVRELVTNPSNDAIDTKKYTDAINVQDLINFLEYEEALTNDPKTRTRITNLLKQLKIWN